MRYSASSSRRVSHPDDPAPIDKTAGSINSTRGGQSGRQRGLWAEGGKAWRHSSAQVACGIPGGCRGYAGGMQGVCRGYAPYWRLALAVRGSGRAARGLFSLPPAVPSPLHRSLPIAPLIRIRGAMGRLRGDHGSMSGRLLRLCRRGVRVSCCTPCEQTQKPATLWLNPNNASRGHR